jgi:hypothetical protein
VFDEDLRKQFEKILYFGGDIAVLVRALSAKFALFGEILKFSYLKESTSTGLHTCHVDRWSSEDMSRKKSGLGQ